MCVSAPCKTASAELHVVGCWQARRGDERLNDRDRFVDVEPDTASEQQREWNRDHDPLEEWRGHSPIAQERCHEMCLETDANGHSTDRDRNSAVQLTRRTRI